MTTPTSVDDMMRRFQRLKKVEQAKYRCNAYGDDSLVCPSTCLPDLKAALFLRFDRVLVKREATLDGMYELADDFGIDRAVTGNAAFIFDRYLAMVVPSYVKGTANLPYRFVVMGSASLLIAAKLHMSKSELGPIKNFVSERENHYSGEIFQAELEILVKLQWDAMYPSPISIIDDMLTLLPCPRSFLDYVELEAFKCLILKFVHPLVKLASVKYGYVTDFPPSTIALAALMIAIEKLQPSSQDVEMRKLSIFRLISFATSVKSGLGCSSVDVDVKKCQQWMMEHSKEGGLKADTPGKIPCPSPANVCEF